MERASAWGFGLGGGLLVGAAVLVSEALLGRVQSPPCPTGWTESTALAIPGATSLRACIRTGESGPRAQRVTLYRTAGESADLVDRALHDVTATTSTPPPAQDGDPPTRAVSADGRLSVASRSVDVAQSPLNAEVYLVAAGHRFGLLNIVHTPDAPFAQPAATAAWMNTIQGASPWGAPDTGEMHASCPAGFETRPPEGARSVVRCIDGLGTSHFTLISLSWDQGGLGSETERAQVASAIASRVAQSQGGEARVIEGPLPFTLAHNVDALRTSVETGEHVPVSVRVVAAIAVSGSRHVLGIGVSESDSETVPVLSELFVVSGATRPPPWLTNHRAWLFAVSAVALGALASALLAHRRA